MGRMVVWCGVRTVVLLVRLVSFAYRRQFAAVYVHRRHGRILVQIQFEALQKSGCLRTIQHICSKGLVSLEDWLVNSPEVVVQCVELKYFVSLVTSTDGERVRAPS